MKQKNFFMMLVLAFGVTTFMTAQVPSYVPTNGLVGYWPFNGNANDMSTNANNGTNNGATLTTDRFGNTASAYSFNGTSNYIKVLDNNSLDLTQNLTLSSWIEPNSLNAEQGILGKGTNTTSTGYALHHKVLNPEKTGVSLQNLSTSSTTFINTSQLSINNWHHLLATYNGSELKLYLNGVLVNTTTTNIQLVSNSLTDLFIGSEFSNFRYFNGKIDDVGIWNRALTEQEISDLFNANICYQSVTVTDTLIINTGILGYNPITYDNAITMYPNPAKDHLTIDCGTLAKVTGYQIKVTNSLGQEVFKTTLNQQQITTPLNAWGGTGMYFVNVYNAQGQQIEVRKIILQ